MTVHSPSTYCAHHDLSRRPRAGAMILLGGILMICLLGTPFGAAGNGLEEPPNYGMLLEFIRMENRNGPLVEFAMTGEGIDRILNAENRCYISRNEPLLEKIRTELDSHDLNWQLREATQRLMVVPENHPEYATLFEGYCRAVIDHVLQETQLPNPYGAIATLAEPLEGAITSLENGITAFLVHNIADVYTEEYVFFDNRNKERKVSVKLDNRVYLGEIGSYSSYLVIEAEHRYSFERNPYTLWRNSAENPLNVLIVPVEETLHIALRDATEAAIRQRLAEKTPATLADIKAVVDEWLAVEEAIVGGLVSELLPGILDRFLAADTALDIAQSFAERQAFQKYRYLSQGIAVVAQLGIRPAIRIYRDHPDRFMALLTRSDPPATARPVEPLPGITQSEPPV